MPFTPFHFGPPALIKGLVPGRFSFSVFCYAQIVTDLEVAYALSRHESVLHGFAHTFPGAVAVGLFCGISGVPLHRLLALRPAWTPFSKLMLKRLTLRVSLLSALLGTLSHVFFDGIMHRDMHPFAPFSDANPLLRIVPPFWIAPFFVVLGIAGAILCGRAEKTVNCD